MSLQVPSGDGREPPAQDDARHHRAGRTAYDTGGGAVTGRIARRGFLGGALSLIPASTASAGPVRGPSTAGDLLTPPPATEGVEPFPVDVPESALQDLRRRLTATRWPDRETVTDDGQGARLEQVQALCAYWRDGYDWRRFEDSLNRIGHYRTSIDGLGLAFLHIRSPHPDALPMIMTHGWPGSIAEFLKVIGPLSDPVAHGGDARDAFHLVVPSLPGYGFSDRPTSPGWDAARTGQAWTALMSRLGYDRYVAQGGDWGAAVTTAMAAARPAGLAAIHLNTLFSPPQPGDELDPSPEAQLAVAQAQIFATQESGYLLEQSTKPQTVGYGLADSPAAQAAWIYEKFQTWTDNPGDVEQVLTRDEVLDDITLYWLTNTGASSARLYWENLGDGLPLVDLPTGISVFVNDTYAPPRAWAERTFTNVTHYNRLEQGGHFAALEQPELFVSEVRDTFRQNR